MLESPILTLVDSRLPLGVILRVQVSFLIAMFATDPVFADVKEGNLIFAQRVKQAVSNLGVGENVRVKVKLQDDTKIKGYISEISENSFTVINSDSRAPTKVLYPQVKQIKRNNLSGLGIAGIIVGGVILGAFLINVFGD